MQERKFECLPFSLDSNTWPADAFWSMLLRGVRSRPGWNYNSIGHTIENFTPTNQLIVKVTLYVCNILQLKMNVILNELPLFVNWDARLCP